MFLSGPFKKILKKLSLYFFLLSAPIAFYRIFFSSFSALNTLSFPIFYPYTNGWNQLVTFADVFLGDEGGYDLAEIMQTNKYLSSINIQCTGIKKAVARGIMDTVQYNTGSSFQELVTGSRFCLHMPCFSSSDFLCSRLHLFFFSICLSSSPSFPLDEGTWNIADHIPVPGLTSTFEVCSSSFSSAFYFHFLSFPFVVAVFHCPFVLDSIFHISLYYVFM